MIKSHHQTFQTLFTSKLEPQLLMEEEDEEDSLQTETLALFDLLWFRRLILSNLPPPPPPPQVKPEEVLLHRRSIIHRRHHSSDDMTCSSPSLIIQPPKLQTILSGKETESFETHVKKERRRWSRRRKKKTGASSSKSLSDLEVEELKGFMDLGFTFSDNAESDPRLREIVPGLQRLKMAAGTEEFQEATSGDDDVAVKVEVEVARPYLSEAWEFEEEQIMLRGMRIRMGGSEMDLKDQLRFWAQAVASTVW